jgi:hypothetical protein
MVTKSWYTNFFFDEGLGKGYYNGHNMDSWASKNLKPGMPPEFQQINMIGSDFAFSEKQGKDFRSEYFFQIVKLNSRGNLKLVS